ncbi:hypothetical protein K431DRAFT_311841 [Polychaeton citri CBS 116435]|uniref:Ornithine decarboxylase antizyme n=1 Tax=Polychaeton citri CBS 116435 TaxID=1314669 RepID=A0A9P4Q855_9PEZI|nr:hypothetical protein K431DRAFT_311841 [Polychaeton citri CBS 116435]
MPYQNIPCTGPLLERGGWFEVPSGVPSPPSSPDLATATSRRRQGAQSKKTRSRTGDAAHHITEECERLFCETLKAVFLVEKNTDLENSLVMDAHIEDSNIGSSSSDSSSDSSISGFALQPPPATATRTPYGLATPSSSPDTMPLKPRGSRRSTAFVHEYVEMWDYIGGGHFRGFVGEQDGERSMFIFFDKEVIGKDQKPGLMALLELASTHHFECDQLLVAVDREADEEDAKDVIRNLGWVGFELTMLDQWASCRDCMSDRWIFLSMDV